MAFEWGLEQSPEVELKGKLHIHEISSANIGLCVWWAFAVLSMNPTPSTARPAVMRVLLPNPDIFFVKHPRARLSDFSVGPSAIHQNTSLTTADGLRQHRVADQWVCALRQRRSC